jgi:hypothetical protein
LSFDDEGYIRHLVGNSLSVGDLEFEKGREISEIKKVLGLKSFGDQDGFMFPWGQEVWLLGDVDGNLDEVVIRVESSPK